MKIIGWDIGGAHIKAAKIDFKKKSLKTKQIYSPVWKNINNLKKSISYINFVPCVCVAPGLREIFVKISNSSVLSLSFMI